MSSPKRQRRAPHRALWFDAIPPELCQRIAAYATGGERNHTALWIAETTPKLRTAIVSLFSFSYKRLCTGSFIHPWIDVFKPDVTTVNLTHPDPPHPLIAAELHLLKVPTLHRAEISDSDAELLAVAESPSLRELRVVVERNASADRLFAALSALHLTKLELFCRALCLHHPRLCLFKQPFFNHANPARNALALTCPTLTSLHITCVCTLSGDPVWRIFPTLPALRELAFSQVAPAEVVPKLRALDSVKVLPVWPEAHRLAVEYAAYDVATAIGSAVTEIRVHDVNLNEKKISALAKCSSLATMKVLLKPGAERALAGAIASMPQLRVLDLTWGSRYADSLLSRHRARIVTYAVAAGGAVLRAVNAAPKLAEVHLTKVRISVSELLEVLTCVGERLEVFETSIGSQEEMPFDRLAVLVRAAAKHNPRLRQFEVEDMAQDTVQKDFYGSGNEAVMKGTRTLREIRRLQMSAPYLNMSSFNYLESRVKSW